MSSTATGLPLATSTWDADELQALQDVISSGRFTMGTKVREYEESFAATVGSRFAVMTNSGSSANLLAVAAAVLDDRIDLRAGDEVLVPAVSWATTYFPLVQYGLCPVLLDIEPHTLNLDVDLARTHCTERTKAIMAVNLLGNPNDFAQLGQLCDDRGLLLLEDNCESLGASYDGRSTGTFGRMGTFSSYFSHHISTMEGGVVVTDDAHLHQMLVSLRSHGWTRGLTADSSLAAPAESDFHDLFRFVLPGYNVRPLEFSGAVGLHQLEKLPDLLVGRRANAARFRDLMADVEGVRLQREVGVSSWFGFSLVLEGALAGRRGDVVDALAAAEVQTRPIVAGNFARSPVMTRMAAKVPAPLPHADDVHDNGLFVGNHHFAVEEGLTTVARALTATSARLAVPDE